MCFNFLSSCVVTVVVFNELEKSSNLLTTNVYMILFSINVKCNQFNIVTSWLRRYGDHNIPMLQSRMPQWN